MAQTSGSRLWEQLRRTLQRRLRASERGERAGTSEPPGTMMHTVNRIERAAWREVLGTMDRLERNQR